MALLEVSEKTGERYEKYYLSDGSGGKYTFYVFIPYEDGSGGYWRREENWQKRDSLIARLSYRHLDVSYLGDGSDLFQEFVRLAILKLKKERPAL